MWKSTYTQPLCTNIWDKRSKKWHRSWTPSSDQVEEMTTCAHAMMSERGQRGTKEKQDTRRSGNWKLAKNKEKEVEQDGKQKRDEQKLDSKKKVMEGGEDKIEEDLAAIQKTMEAAAGKSGAPHQSWKRKHLYRVRQKMSDYVRTLLQDARKRSRGERSRIKPGKQGLNTWWKASWNQGRRGWKETCGPNF